MFGIDNYPGFVIAVLVFLAVPGPGLLSVLTSTASSGMRAGFASTLGIVGGDWMHMLLASIGLAALLQAHPSLFRALQYLGALYLIYIGISLLRSRDSCAEEHGNPAGRHMRRSFLITLMNPKAIVFYMAFFPLFIDPGRHQGVVTLLAMAATVSALTILFCFSVVIVVHSVAGKLKRNKIISGIARRAAGIFLIGFGIKLTTN